MKRGTANHPKMADLAAKLQQPKYVPVGILELLWHFTAQYTPAGDVGKYSDAAIADAIGWKDDPRALVNILLDAKWLDQNTEHRLIVHDWPEHAEDSVHIALARKTLLFAQGAFPVLTRLGKLERAKIARAYMQKFPERFSGDGVDLSASYINELAENAQETHKKRTAKPSQAMPSHTSTPTAEGVEGELAKRMQARRNAQ